ncbi:unnamed protein product, partial [Mesorhabditis spiculigera]
MKPHWIDVLFPSTRTDSCHPEIKRLERDLYEPDGPRDSLRALILFLLFAMTFGAFMLARIFQAPWAQRAVLPLVSMIGGGVFLSTCLLDILPDAMESLEKAEIDMEFPLAEACLGLGFVIVLTIEQVAIHLQEIGVIGGSHVQIHDHDHGESHASHEHSAIQEAPDSSAALSAIIMVVAISVHALFEGVSLAIIDEPAKLLQIFLALAIHKTIIGFTLGIRLWQSGLRQLVIVICGLILAIQVMIGGLAGISLMHFLSGGSRATAALVTTVLQGFSCGTFLYITTCEILPHELGKPGLRLAKLGAMCFGCLIVLAFTLAFPDT